MWLDRWLPWRHSPDSPVASGSAADVRPAPTVRPVAGWRSVPPIQRAVADPALVSPPDRIRPALLSWRDPSFLAPLGHVVDPQAPAGYVHDAVIPAPEPVAPAGPADLAVASHAPVPAKPPTALQRLAQLAGVAPSSATSSGGSVPPAGGSVASAGSSASAGQSGGGDAGTGSGGALPVVSRLATPGGAVVSHASVGSSGFGAAAGSSGSGPVGSSDAGPPGGAVVSRALAGSASVADS